jgi:hypothetical protein
VYLRDRAISVHIRDAQDYLEAIYPVGKADRNTVGAWLTIRTDNERRAKYDTPIEIRPLLLTLFNTPASSTNCSSATRLSGRPPSNTTSRAWS